MAWTRRVVARPEVEGPDGALSARQTKGPVKGTAPRLSPTVMHSACNIQPTRNHIRDEKHPYLCAKSPIEHPIARNTAQRDPRHRRQIGHLSSLDVEGVVRANTPSDDCRAVASRGHRCC